MIKQKLLIMNRSYRPLTPQGLVIHSTATPGATAEKEYQYFNRAYRAASAHYFVDWQEIIRTIPETEVAWHAGKTANARYLSVEMCEPLGSNPAQFHEVWKRTVWLVADACVRYGWNPDCDVFSHRQISLLYRESTHVDPHHYLEQYGQTWEKLLAAIRRQIEELKDKPSTIILVNPGPDERAAAYLADFLQTNMTLLPEVKSSDLDAFERVFVVGGAYKPIARAILLSGCDRYETCQQVLNYIRSRSTSTVPTPTPYKTAFRPKDKPFTSG